tara:strand:+ start:63 stop:428 length:366 start_codon:yes stop_codon:yes gene_type:complete
MTHPSRKKYANVYTKKKYEGGASEKMKAEVTEAAKKERDRLQARHVSPGGGGKYKYGPHKVDVNRRATEELLPFLNKNIKEKIIKSADKFDAKQKEEGKKKRALIDLTKKGKKLTAYKGYT